MEESRGELRKTTAVTESMGSFCVSNPSLVDLCIDAEEFAADEEDEAEEGELTPPPVLLVGPSTIIASLNCDKAS